MEMGASFGKGCIYIYIYTLGLVPSHACLSLVAEIVLLFKFLFISSLVVQGNLCRWLILGSHRSLGILQIV